MKHPRPEEMAEQMGADASAIVALLEEAVAVQWQRSRRVAKVEDAGIRSKGLPSRPTEDTALDPVRLALRAEVDASARLLVRAHRDLYLQHGKLLRALEAWQGE